MRKVFRRDNANDKMQKNPFGWLVVVLVSCIGCSRSSLAELFKLRTECSNQARSFESAWRAENGSDFQFLYFSNYYNQKMGRCFVKSFYGHPDVKLTVVHDATEGIGKPPLVISIAGNDKAARETSEHRQLVAKINDFTDGGPVMHWSDAAEGSLESTRTSDCQVIEFRYAIKELGHPLMMGMTRKPRIGDFFIG